jgi:SPP1 gp7 family putative phage head morphogenesis protein
LLPDAIIRAIETITQRELDAIKALARDKREPEREKKERLSRMIYRVLRKRFARQLERLRFRVQMAFPGRPTKAISDYINLDDILDDNPEDANELIALITAAARGGIDLAKLQTRLELDYGLTNVEAAVWARRYAFDLIKDIDTSTAEVIRSGVRNFIDNPEYTMKDLFELLEPEFGRARAERIATTEVTRAYAQGQQMAGDTLKEQFPDVKVVDTWFTNNDDLVCPLCGPLDGEEREHGELFYAVEDDQYEDGYPPRHPNCRCWISSTTRL